MYNYFWLFILFLSLSSDLLAFELLSDIDMDNNENTRVKTHYGIGYEQRKTLLRNQASSNSPENTLFTRPTSRVQVQKIDRPIRPYRPQRPIRPGR